MAGDRAPQTAPVRDGGRTLAALDLARLRAHIDAALRRARDDGAVVLAAVTFELEPAADPTALALAARRGEEPWFSLERPDAGGQALAGCGCAAALETSGEGRLQTVAASWRALCDRAHADRPSAPRGSGLVAVGGFAFAPEDSAGPRWQGFAPASLHVPELADGRQARDAGRRLGHCAERRLGLGVQIKLHRERHDRCPQSGSWRVFRVPAARAFSR